MQFNGGAVFTCLDLFASSNLGSKVKDDFNYVAEQRRKAQLV